MTPRAPESARLRFREYASTDEQNVVALFADPAARAFYPEMADLAGARCWIEWNLQNYNAFGYGLWALELKESGAFVGDCGLTWQDVEGQRRLEIGYHLLAAYRGHGYATEAARGCLDFAFACTDVALVCSIVSPRNGASCAVARRIHASSREFVRKGQPMLLFYTLRAA